MAKGGGVILLIMFCALAVGIFWYVSTIPPETNDIDNTQNTLNTPVNSLMSNLTIVSWNLKIFGQDKASDAALMNKYAAIINKYDVVFVQEIRDISETAFNKLCSLLPDYSCLSSSRAGRTSSKEQQGLLYRKGVVVLEFKDYNPDSADRWERPPVKTVIQISEVYGSEVLVKNLTIWSNHIKPEDVINEMTNLQTLVMENSNINQPLLILGDLNFDCTYANHNTFQPFNGYFWVIPDDADTTVGSTDCSYDRMISNFGVTEYGIDTSVTEDMSDHYPIFLKI